MFFALSKIFGFFAVPSNLLILMGLVGALLLRTRFLRMGRRLLAATLILVALVGFLPIGSALLLPLEDRFPQWDPAQGPLPSGIIVLGGVINTERSAARHQISLDEAAERITSAVELARKYPAARIVISGGNSELLQGPPESDFALRLLENLGVQRDRITLKSQSRNTAENAAFTKARRRSQTGRALAVDYVRRAHAARNRFLSSRWFSS